MCIYITHNIYEGSKSILGVSCYDLYLPKKKTDKKNVLVDILGSPAGQ